LLQLLLMTGILDRPRKPLCQPLHIITCCSPILLVLLSLYVARQYCLWMSFAHIDWPHWLVILFIDHMSSHTRRLHRPLTLLMSSLFVSYCLLYYWWTSFGLYFSDLLQHCLAFYYAPDCLVSLFLHIACFVVWVHCLPRCSALLRGYFVFILFAEIVIGCSYWVIWLLASWFGFIALFDCFGTLLWYITWLDCFGILLCYIALVDCLFCCLVDHLMKGPSNTIYEMVRCESWSSH